MAVSSASERNARLLLASLGLKLSERDARSLLARIVLNPRIVENPYWFLPVVDDGHSVYLQAGRGNVSSVDWCGKRKGRRVCHNKEHHNVVYKGVDFSGKNVVMNSYYHCHGVLCVVCFLSGFSVWEGRVIEGRIAEAVERGYGVAEHIVLSPPKSLLGLPFLELFKLGEKAFRRRGGSGAVLIPHGRRIDRRGRRLVWSHHIHEIGFIFSGYRCRGCEFLQHSGTNVYCGAPAGSCDGFEQVTRREYEWDGWIVKVEPSRKTVYGTAYYLLNHCTVKVGLRRFHAVRWFGLLANRVFRAVKGKSVAGCPVCKEGGYCSVMVSEAYWGKEPLSDSGVNAVPDFDVDGKPNFPSVEGV